MQELYFEDTTPDTLLVQTSLWFEQRIWRNDTDWDFRANLYELANQGLIPLVSHQTLNTFCKERLSSQSEDKNSRIANLFRIELIQAAMDTSLAYHVGLELAKMIFYSYPIPSARISPERLNPLQENLQAVYGISRGNSWRIIFCDLAGQRLYELLNNRDELGFSMDMLRRTISIYRFNLLSEVWRSLGSELEQPVYSSVRYFVKGRLSYLAKEIFTIDSERDLMVMEALRLD